MLEAWTALALAAIGKVDLVLVDESASQQHNVPTFSAHHPQREHVCVENEIAIFSSLSLSFFVLTVDVPARSVVDYRCLAMYTYLPS